MEFGWILVYFWLTLSISDPGTGASPTTVNGARGKSVSLLPGITVRPDIAQLVWRLLSPRRKIVTYANKNIDYYGSEEYKRRITFHPGNFSLEIHDLRREDSGDYEVTVTASSGAQTQEVIRLEVYDPVSGTDIMVQYNVKTCNITLICSANSGSSISYRWWRGEEAVGNDSHYHVQQHGEEKMIIVVLYKCEAWNLISNETTQVWLGDKCEKDKSDQIPTLEIAVGHIAWFTTDILNAADVTEVVWRNLSVPAKIAECKNGKPSYLDTEKYKGRIDLQPGNCSLKIRDVQKEDSDVYEVIVTARSGTRTKMKMHLKVFDPDAGEKSIHIAWIILIVFFLIVILVFCIIFYIMRQDCCSRRDTRMGKKSDTSIGQVESQPLKKQ